MENERDSTCRDHLRYCRENNMIMCQTCRRSWKQHDDEGLCGAAIYHDEGFPPIPRNLYYYPNIHPPVSNIKWSRISDFGVNAIFNTWNWNAIIDTAQPQDAIQVRTEDCWLIAAMALLPKNQNVLKNLFPSYQNYPKGMYSLRLYSFGTWHNVLVDDFVPCDQNFQPFHAKVYRMWAALLEKAVAKFYGCYEALYGGAIVESLNLLTGAPSTYTFLSEELDIRFTPDRFWNQLGYSLDQNYLILANSAGSTKKADADAEFINVGLLKLHAYCILNIRIVRGRRLIKLLNPNCVEYKGPWSYEHMINEPALQEQLYQGCGEGEFWMDYNIFLEFFESVCVSKIRNDYNKLSLKGTLYPLLLKCPTGIYFEIKKRTFVDFVLHQRTRRWNPADRRFLMDLFFLIFKKQPNGMYHYYAHSIRAVATLVSLDLDLLPGDYFLVPLSFNHYAKTFIETVHLQCLLEMFTRDAVFTNRRWCRFDKLKDTFINMVKGIGKTKQYQSAFVYEYSKSFDGVAVVVENRESRRWLSATCMYVGEPDKYESTRGALTTRDVLPPRHTQVIAVLTLTRGTHNARATYFDYQLDVLGEQNPQQPKHIPYINYSRDHMHRPYLHVNP